MKKIFPLFLILGLLFACEDVIDVDLNEAPPRLVIQADFNISSTGSSTPFVRLTTTAPFFEEENPIVPDATVFVTDDLGNSFAFRYADNGFYSGNLVPQPNINYTLNIEYLGETYTAVEMLQPTATLLYVEQKNDGGFLGEDIELKAVFKDSLGIRNFYFSESRSDKGISLDVYDDEFFDGNLIFTYYVVEDLEAGDVVSFSLYGIDEKYYNYMFLLLQQSGDGGGPFATQPATVRGNFVNKTNPDNFAFGYFRISELSTLDYTVQ